MELMSELNRDAKGDFLRSLFLWDSKRLAIESQKKVEQYIKTGEGIYFVESYLLGQVLLLKENQSSFFDDYKKMGGDFLKLLQVSAPSMLQKYIFDGKVFRLTEPVYNLLENTKNKVFLRKHPFYTFAIDQKVKTKYEGLNIIFMIFYEVATDFKKCDGCNYLVLGKDERDNSEFWLKGDISFPLKSLSAGDDFNKEETVELHKKIKWMYSNFLDYLNHPYSKQTIYKLSHNTEKRIRRGKFPRQDKIILDIKPEFIYESKVGKEHSKRRSGCKFWIRGHFRHFRNKERYQRLYSLKKKDLEEEKFFYNGGHISKWIIPYIKGEGKLKERIRRLK